MRLVACVGAVTRVFALLTVWSMPVWLISVSGCAPDKTALLQQELQRCAESADEDHGIRGCMIAIQDGALEQPDRWPKTERFFLRMGTGAAQAGRFNDVADIYRRGIRILPASAMLQYRLGEELLNRRDLPGEAEPCYLEATRLNPGFTKAYVGLGYARLRLKRPEEALKAFETAMRSPDADDRVRIAYTYGLAAVGRHEEAVEILTKIGLKEDDVARLQLAASLIEIGRPADALGIYEELKKASPGFAEMAGCGVARALSAMKETAKASAACREALKRAPRHPGSLPCPCTP